MKAKKNAGNPVTLGELALLFKTGYKNIVNETDDWRPLAQHVMDLMLAVQSGTLVVEGERGRTSIKERKTNAAKQK